MPWEKQFNVDEALGKAMDAFWAHGYEATSMQDLVDCMGINRGSLYATFGDKHRLFVQALRRYDHLYRHEWVETLSQTRSPREAVLGAFEDAIAAVVEDGKRDGCLLVNTALELSPHDAEVGEIVSHGLAEMEDFFAGMISAGHATGEISAAVDATETARGLLSLFLGLRVLARSRPEPSVLRSVARQAEVLIT